MKWPWVSRYRLEDSERRLATVDIERQRLLDLLLGGGAAQALVRAPLKMPLAALAEDDGIRPVQETPGDPVASFTTPFDRIEARFKNKFAKGNIPAQYRARAN